VFKEVRGSVDALEAVARELEPWRLDGRDAVALVELAARGERICASIKALGARRVEETKVWREGGHRSAAIGWQRKQVSPSGAAARTLETARALERLSETDAAFRAGELSETQAAEITSTAVADPGAETELLAAAGSTSVKGLRDRCRQVRAGAQDDDRAWARRLHESRRAHKWTDPDGAYCVSGRMAPDAGPASTRHGRHIPTASSAKHDAPVAANRALPMPPTRSSRW
jgi:hypothetical protein